MLLLSLQNLVLYAQSNDTWRPYSFQAFYYVYITVEPHHASSLQAVAASDLLHFCVTIYCKRCMILHPSKAPHIEFSSSCRLCITAPIIFIDQTSREGGPLISGWSPSRSVYVTGMVSVICTSESETSQLFSIFYYVRIPKTMTSLPLSYRTDSPQCCQ